MVVLPRAGDSQQYLGCAVLQFKGEAVEDDLLIEAQAHIFKDYGLWPCSRPIAAGLAHGL